MANNMSSSKHSKGHIHQAANYLHGKFENHGVQWNGSNVTVSGDVIFNTPHLGKDDNTLEREAKKALCHNFRDPIDDRRSILSRKPRMITATCDWIINDPRYKHWRNVRTRSQLLWVSGGQARGKTMLSIFLTQSFDKLAQHAGEITVLYYFIERQDNRDTASHVLRGLIRRLIAVRKDLIKYLVEYYEDSGNDLFGPNYIETLWRVFEDMIRDPIAGQVYCIIDGLDGCKEESLQRLVGLVRDFFLDEPQIVVDEGVPPDSYGNSSAPKKAGQKVGLGLKMMLVSREEPEWLSEYLRDFTRIPVGGGSSKKAGKAGINSARPGKKPPTLKEVASTIIRKQTLQKPDKLETVDGATTTTTSSNTSTQVAPISSPPPPYYASTSMPNTSSASNDQTVYTSGALALTSGHVPTNAQVGSPVAGVSAVPQDLVLTGSSIAPFSPQPDTSTPYQLAPAESALQNPTQSTLTTAASGNQNATTSSDTGGFTGLSNQQYNAPVPGIHSQDTTSTQQPTFLAGLSGSTTAQRPGQPSRKSSEAIQSTVSVTSSSPSATASSSKPVFHEVTYSDEPTEYIDQKPDGTADPQETQETHIDEDEMDEDYNPSLRVYIEAKMEELAQERQYSTEVQSFICAALEYRGDGTFLWVDFAIEEIKKVNVDNMEETCNSLPPTLEEMYVRILLNIPPNLVDLVVGLLRWTICARRPMDLLELWIALNLSHYSSQDAINYITATVLACGNMISVQTEDLTVNLIHQSLIDFLTSDSSLLMQDPRLSRFHIIPSQIHGDITTFCISYLESGPFNDHPICQFEREPVYNEHIMKYPFLPYAASFWPDHLKEASNPHLNLSSPFFLPKSKARKNWWVTYWAFTTGKATLSAPRNFTVLHLAAYLDLVPVAQQVSQRGELQSRLNKRDSHGSTPLDYAVARGNIPMFQFLLMHNAKQETLGETLLELAVRKGQKEMVAFLLNMGWDVNLRAKQETPLGSLWTMARWLPGAFSEGLDLNRDTWHMTFRDIGVQATPLHQAATYGHVTVMELLLERGAQVDAGTTKGFTPLHSASYVGAMDCVELLLEHGASPNWVTTDHWLPMHYAAMRGKLNVVELYLDRGVPIDAVTIKSKTALQLAAYAGHAELVEFLFQRGANLEMKSYKAETALHLATRHAMPQTVEVLLSLGADRNVVNNEGFSPVQVAQASTLVNSKECLRILQTFGMEGYVPWQPPEQPGAATGTQAQPAAAAVDGSNAGADAPDGRRTSAASPPAPAARAFANTAVPRTNTFQSFEASISVQVQPAHQGYPAAGQQVPIQPTPTGLSTGTVTAPQPHSDSTRSVPAQPGSKFAYDANANMNQYGDDKGAAFGSMSPPSVAPPPYSAAVGNNPPPIFPEKSPAWTTSINQGSQAPWQASASASPPTQSVPPLQVTPPTQAYHQQPQPHQYLNTSNTPATQEPAIGSRSITQQPNQSSLVAMLSSFAISSTPSRSVTPSMSEQPGQTLSPQSVHSPPPSIQSPNSLAIQTQQLYQPSPTPVAQYQFPPTASVQAAPPTLISPIQPIAAPVTPHQTPSVPVQPFAPVQQPYQYSATPVQTFTPVPQQQQQPYQNAGYPLQQAVSQHQQATIYQPSPTPAPTPLPYSSPQIQQPQPQYLTPTVPQTPYIPQATALPTQSPHFSGNTTASTYNSGYEYSAPPPAPYDPHLGQVPQVPGQMPMQPAWQGQQGGYQVGYPSAVPMQNGGMMFAPPPPQGSGKRKSFLGGLVGGR